MSRKLYTNLRRRAAAWAGQLTKIAKELAPNHVKGAISSHVEDKEDGTFRIKIYANRKIAPDARAQEYGSGLRARRGAKKKYPIYPKKGKLLAFNWEVANANPENFSFLPDGRVLLSKVEHPGIQATNDGKGYIGPAMKELRKRARKSLSKEVRDAILSDLRTAFEAFERK